MMVCGKYSWTSEDTLPLSSCLLYACVVCARFCEMMRPICSNLAYYGQLGSYGFSVFISTDRRACVYRHGFTWTKSRLFVDVALSDCLAASSGPTTGSMCKGALPGRGTHLIALKNQTNRDNLVRPDRDFECVCILKHNRLLIPFDRIRRNDFAHR